MITDKATFCKKVIVLAALFTMIFPVVHVGATMGNVNNFIYSEDQFAGDKDSAMNYFLKYRAEGYPAKYTERPESIYGLQQHIKYSESVFISCHGTKEGSELLLDSSGSKIIFGTFDVPSGMNCKLAYISACRGAQNNVNTGKNLCIDLINNGYKAAVGYSDDVRTSLSRMYECEFFFNLAEGKSVYGALDATNKYLKDEYKNLFDEIIDSVERFGDLGVKP